MEAALYDVIVIGGGPAGISASLYTVRGNLKTLVLDAGASSLNKAEKIENYYGFAEPVSGQALLETGVKQAQRLGAVLQSEEVTALEMQQDGFVVKTSAAEYIARAVLIATGKSPNRPKLPGVAELESKGISYCTTCDGFFYRGKTVGILGGGNFAIQEATELTAFTNNITIYTNGNDAAFTGIYQRQAETFKINTERVTGVSGEKKLEKILLESGPQSLDGLFIALGTASSADLAVKLGISVNNSGDIVIDARQKTNLDGIFAAGDCTGGFKQVSAAVGQGAAAGKSIIEYVRGR